ncbi:unnamed protein product [Closterium sp. NIES-53]
MTSLRSSGGSGDGGGDSSGSGDGRSRSRCGAVQWGVFGAAQMQLQQCPRETLPPQQLRERYASRSGGGGSSGSRCAAIQLGVFGGGLAQLQRRPCDTLMPQQLRIEAATLGASESALPGTAPAEALHTFTLDSGASRCFFRDSTTLTPLSAPVLIRRADTSRGPVLARSSSVLPCLAVPSGSLSGLHLPSFSTNLVSTAALQDSMVTTTTPGGQSVSICTCTRTGRHLTTFTRRPGSSLYTLATEPPQVAASSVRIRSGSTPLLVSPPVTPDSPVAPPTWSPLPATTSWHALLPPCLWSAQGLARVSGQGRERYFLLVVDDYTRYTMVFPLRSKGEVPDVLIPWIRVVRLQIRERSRHDLPVLRLHFERGGEFSSDLLRNFCRGEGILQSFMLPDSPQQNGIAMCRIGLFMETSPALRWTGEVGVASVFEVRGSRAFVRNTFADKLSARAIPYVFFGFPPDTPGWQFYHPTSRRVFPSQDVTFDESVPFYYLFPYRSAPLPPPPLFLAPSPPPVDPHPPQGPAPSGVSQVDPLPGTVLVEVAVDSGAARGAAPGGAVSGGAEPARAEPGSDEPEGAESEGAGSGGAKPGGAEPEGAEPLGAEPGGGEPKGAEPKGAELEGAESGGAEPRGTASSGGPTGAWPRLSPRPEPLSPQQLREWFARRTRLCSGAAGAGDSAAGGTGAGGVGATCLGGAEVTVGAGGTGGGGAAGPGGARPRGTGAARTGGVGGAGAGGAGAGDPCAGGTGTGGTGDGGTGAGGTSAGGAGARGAGVGDTNAVDPGAGGAGTGDSPLLAPSPYAEQTDSFTERHEPESRLASLVRAVRTGRQVPRPRPPSVPGTHVMALRPSSVPLRVPLPPPPESSLPAVPDPHSDVARGASPNVSCLLATVVTDPSFESVATSAFVAELVDFAAACRLDYATAVVAESESACPPSVEGECALGTDVLEDRQEEFECLAAAVTHLVAMLIAPKGDPDAPHIPTPHSYAEAITVPPSGANIVDDMWIFRVKRPSGSPPAFKARYVARRFSQRQGVDYFKTFSPTPKMTTLRWSLRRPVYGLRQAPREWHDTLRTTLAALGFAPSTADPSLFLRTDTSLPPFYVLVYVDDLVFATTATEALALVKSERQKRHTCTDQGSSALRLPVLLAVNGSCVLAPVLAWAELTLWLGVREVQPTCSSGRRRLGRAGRRGWSTCTGPLQCRRLGKPADDFNWWSAMWHVDLEVGVDLGGRLMTVLVDVELVDQE